MEIFQIPGLGTKRSLKMRNKILQTPSGVVSLTYYPQSFTHPSVFSCIQMLVFPGDLFLIGSKNATKSQNVLQHMTFWRFVAFLSY